MPRFAILRHETPPDSPRRVHWDFLLECGAALRTWALAELPVEGLPIEAQPLPDHRLIYLDYQGPISGGRGCVTQWDAGTFAWEQNTPGEVVVRLSGKVLRGRVTLRRNNEDEAAWTFLFQLAGASIQPA